MLLFVVIFFLMFLCSKVKLFSAMLIDSQLLPSFLFSQGILKHSQMYYLSFSTEKYFLFVCPF